MLCQVPNATQAYVLSVPCVVHSVYVVAILLLQCEVQLVGRKVDERLFFLHSRLHLNEHHPRRGPRSKGELEVVGLAGLSALIAPQDVRRSSRVAAVSPATQEGADQLFPPLTDGLQVHLFIQYHRLQKRGADISKTQTKTVTSL